MNSERRITYGAMTTVVPGAVWALYEDAEQVTVYHPVVALVVQRVEYSDGASEEDVVPVTARQLGRHIADCRGNLMDGLLNVVGSLDEARAIVEEDRASAAAAAARKAAGGRP